ncbi:zinc finger protein 3-like [Centropristis striata]|uniref:zinc finger protein 3-like n=1 Tax=Centropristis striata TaxID=184440 RepID=UPI0027E053CE|nr:zinc finger protein 3-like [Centropristis striata]
MSSFEYLKEFVNERLAAAVEEIFSVFEKTISEYEEEIDRQRRLLNIVWKPEIKLHRITPELPQQHVCKEEEERNSSLDQEDTDPPQIKEEPEELSTSQQGEQLVVKQETDPCLFTPTSEQSDHSEDQFFNPARSQSEAETELPASMCISWLKDKSACEAYEPNSDHQLITYNSHAAESQTHAGGKQGGPESTRNAGKKQKKRHHNSFIHTNNLCEPTMSTIHCNAPTDKKSLECDTCGKAFKYQSKLQRHQRIHSGEKPYSCSICGKGFSVITVLTTHMRMHTGEKPFLCKTCGKSFCEMSVLKRHIRIHTGERPYTCTTCGRAFRRNGDLVVHMRMHSGEKPYTCNTCGKDFRSSSNLRCHLKTHTEEKLQFHCSTDVSGGVGSIRMISYIPEKHVEEVSLQ